MEESGFGRALKLLDNVGDAVLVTEGEPVVGSPRVIYANKAFATSSGYSPTEIVGQSPTILQGEDSSLATKKIREKISHWENVKAEMKNYRKDGEPFTVELNISPMFDDYGWYTHWASFQRNITKFEIKRKAFERIQENAKVGFWTLNVKTEDTIWSSEVYKIYNVPKDTIPNKVDGISFYATHERERISRCVTECITEKKSYDEVFEFYDAAGKKKWARVAGEPQIEPDGDVYEIFGTFQDVTDFVNERLKYQQLVESSPDIIYRLNAKGDFIFVSQSWEKLLGDKVSSVIGKHFKEFVHPDDLSKCQREFESVIKKEKDSVVLEYRVIHHDGSYRYHRSHGTLSKDGDAVFQGIASDITEVKETQEDLSSILAGAKAGLWKWNLKDNSLFWDESTYQVYGISKERFSGAFEAWESSLHPDYKEETLTDVQLMLEGKKEFDRYFGVITETGELRYISGIASVIRLFGVKILFHYRWY